MEVPDIATSPAPLRADSLRGVRLLDGGREAFPLMLEAIEGARADVHLEMYALELDAVGERFLEALCRASRRGIAVSIVVDGWGSLGFTGEILERVRSAGGKARVYNPPRHMLVGRLVRNHRKVLVVDHDIAFVGGINIGERYAAWDDLAVQLTGPVCKTLKRELSSKRSATRIDADVRILLSGFRGGQLLRREYLEAITGAQERVLLAHAYFLPDRGILHALCAAARRNVHVTLLVPHKSDVWLSALGTRRLYRRLLAAGVRIHELTGRILHTKAAVADGRRSLVGSFNLDPLSLTNLEALVCLEDPTFGAALEGWIVSRIANALEVTVADATPLGLLHRIRDLMGFWVRRGAFWLARWISHGKSR